jgi:hypothetical protein
MLVVCKYRSKNIMFIVVILTYLKLGKTVMVLDIFNVRWKFLVIVFD